MGILLCDCLVLFYSIYVYVILQSIDQLHREDSDKESSGEPLSTD
jgi:hypothetical protein